MLHQGPPPGIFMECPVCQVVFQGPLCNMAWWFYRGLFYKLFHRLREHSPSVGVTLGVDFQCLLKTTPETLGNFHISTSFCPNCLVAGILIELCVFIQWVTVSCLFHSSGDK